MPAFPLLWPIIAMAALIFVVWFTLFWQRMVHMRRNPARAEDFATGDAALRYFAPVEMPANNLRNLFEMPVLFFVIAILLLVTELANDIQLLLAWAFVALRAIHSFIHIATRRVPLRFLAYAASVAVLLAMWIGFTVDAAAAAHAYDETMATLEARAPRQ